MDAKKIQYQTYIYLHCSPHTVSGPIIRKEKLRRKSENAANVNPTITMWTGVSKYQNTKLQLVQGNNPAYTSPIYCTNLGISLIGWFSADV